MLRISLKGGEIMRDYETLLKPVWGLDNDDVKPLVDAVKSFVKSNDRSKIEKCIRSLEEMLRTIPEDHRSLKDWAFEAEVKAKIAVLKAILSGEASDWEAASAAYQELKNVLNSLAASCGLCEDIAEAMFKADAEHANELAALCLKQVKKQAKHKKREAERMLFAEEAKSLIAKVGPKLGYDYTESPVFPKGRTDVCAVRHSAEDGYSYGYDTIYLVWRSKDGIKYRELINTSYSKDYVHIERVYVKNGMIVVEVRSGGSYSGSPWEKSIKISLAELV
jgi:hypothetical protein